MRWPLPFLRPFPPRSPPPTCLPVLFEASSVLCSLLRPSGPASAPRLPEPTRDRQGGCGRPEVSQVPTRSLTARTGPRWSPRRTVPHMLPAAVRNASASTVRVFRGSIQSSSSRCVRFATIVADDPATLATGRVLPPTRTGLPPAGSRQLRLAHANRLLTQHMAFAGLAENRHGRMAFPISPGSESGHDSS